MLAEMWPFCCLFVVQIWQTGADHPSAIISHDVGHMEVSGVGHSSFAISEDTTVQIMFTGNLRNFKLNIIECCSFVR